MSLLFKSSLVLCCVSLATAANAMVGAFRAECRDDGEYNPVQCQPGTNNFCWCVDLFGKEIAGTRVVGGEVPTCELMTPCRMLRSKAVAGKPARGAFVPKCDADGSFSNIQCHTSTGYCFCVDPAGHEFPGSRIRGTPDCSKFVVDAPMTACREWYAATPSLLGAFRPQCDEQGEFMTRQCHGSTGQCWCVDTRGNEIDGTRRPAAQLARCNRVSQCEVDRDGPRIATAMTLIGKFTPKCDVNGDFASMQCSSSTGSCWCVDQDGAELPATRAGPTRTADPVCKQMTPCLTTRATTKAVYGAFLPLCEEDGSYSRKQCWGSTGQCWCVDSMGREVDGTRVRGEVNCEALDIPSPMSACQLWTSSVPSLLGAFRPECDASGEFFPVQCHGSTGMCWCVDTKGNELQGTRVAAPRRPRCTRVTPCEVSRDGVNAIVVEA